MKDALKKIYHYLKAQRRLIKYPYWFVIDLAYRLKVFDVHNIPVVINNFNRLTFPLQLVGFLEACGCKRIIFLDNQSTFPPLLEFYKTTSHAVVRCDTNFGHLAFWKSGLYKKFRWNYFVYTDSDVLPLSETPPAFLTHFQQVLRSHYKLDKVGFGIRIDDIPDHFEWKSKVVAYETGYWQKRVEEDLYDAPIDTTFALYRPLSDLKNGEVHTLKAWRTGYPYLVRHLPWYVDSANASQEEMFYMSTSNSSSSIAKQQHGGDSVY